MTFDPKTFDPMKEELDYEQACYFYNTKTNYFKLYEKPPVRSHNTEHAVKFFTGVEVEATPVKGCKTLFVVGLADKEEIIMHYENSGATHIYFGADLSFTAESNTVKWLLMMAPFLNRLIPCTLDMCIIQAAKVNKHIIKTNCAALIPLIRMPMPNLDNFNANTTIKIDDHWNGSNGGVYCAKLDSLTVAHNFTPWSAYSKDEPIWTL